MKTNMFKWLFYAVVLFLNTTLLQVHAQHYMNREWENVFGTPLNTDWSASTLEANGNLTVVGNTLNGVGNTDILLTSYDKYGNLRWSQTYNHTTNANDYGITITSDNSGNIYVAGAVTDFAGFYDWFVGMYDTNGNNVWTTFYNGIGYDIPVAIALNSAGDVCVTGITTGAITQTDYLTVMYSSSGSQIWETTYDYLGLNDAPISLKISSTGDVIVTGGSQSASNTADYCTIRYNTSGTQTGLDRQTIAGAGLDKPYGMVKDNVGNILITGYFQNGTNADIRTIKLDSAFVFQWAKTYDEASLEDVGKSIATDNSGNVFVTGTITDANNIKQIVTLKYNATGTQQWLMKYVCKTKTGYFPTEAEKISVDNQGNIYIVGTITRPSGKDIFIICYDTNGKLKWLSDTEILGDNLAKDIQTHQNETYITQIRDLNGVKQYECLKLESFQRVNQALYDSLGNPSHLKNQVLIRFSPSATLPTFFASRERTHGKLSDFIKSNVISQMETKLGMTGQLSNAKVVKAIPFLTPADSISYSRMGEQLRLDSYWTSLLLFIPEARAIQDEEEIADSLSHMKPMIFYANANYLYSYMVGANDPEYFANQKSLHVTAFSGYTINVPPAWDITTGRTDINIGVYDSGIDWGHPDFTTNGDGTWQNSVVINGYDFEHLTVLDQNNSALNDITGHGTKMAGIIAACRNNNDALGNPIGIAGIAGGDYSAGGTSLTGVTLDMMRVGDNEPSLDVVANAIYYGAINTPQTPTGIGYEQDIMNFSFGGPDYNNYLRIAMAEAYRHKIMLFCARGNNGATANPASAVYPASLNSSFDDWLICVGGTDKFGMKDPIASTMNIDISAPSVSTMIKTTGIGNTYVTSNGTSSSTPHIAGIAALMLSYFNQLTPSTMNLTSEDVEFLIQKYADISTTFGQPDPEIGYGIADAGNTLQHIQFPNYDVLHISTNVVWNDLVYIGPQNLDLAYDIDLGGGHIIPAGIQNVDIYSFSKQVDAAPYIPANWNVINSWGVSSMSEYYPDFLNATYGGSLFVEPHIEFTPDINDLTKGTITGYAYQFYDAVNNNYPMMPNINGEGVVTFSVHIQNGTVGIDKPNNQNITISPNPTNNLLNIQTENNLTVENIRIIDMTGKMVKEIQEPFTNNKLQINVKDLASGMYAIVINSKGNISTQRFIKN